MTPKQKMFVKEYLIDLNATQSAIRAGYSEKRAHEIGYQVLRKTPVAAAIQKAMAERETRTEITSEYVLVNLREVAERCMQKTPVKNRKGQQAKDENGCDVWTFDAGGANKALELLGKHLALFTDKVNMDVSGSLGLVILPESKLDG